MVPPRLPTCIAPLLALILAGGAVCADELGRPPLQVYRQADYRQHPQNWAVVQGDDGLMFFGNTDGVLTFDGETWELIPLPNGSIVRSLAKGEDGTIWVGGVGELGYLAPRGAEDPTEGADRRAPRLELRSLVDLLPRPVRRFGDVWRTFATPDGVYFQAGTDTLLRWADGAFRHWDLGSGRQVVLEVDGRILYTRTGEGLTELVDDELVPVPGGEALASMRPMAAVPDPRGGWLFATRRRGLVRLSADGEGSVGLEPVPTEVDERLAAHRIYAAAALSGGGLALATVSGGVFVVGHDGRLIHALNREGGLPDDAVWSVGTDSEGGLWLATDRGLARADVRSSCTVFAHDRGVEATVEALVRHEGTLYAATRRGVVAQRGGRFEPVREGGGISWSLLDFREPTPGGGRRLLVGTGTGVVDRSRPSPGRILSTHNAYVLHQLRSDPSRVLVGSQTGLHGLRFEGGTWRVDPTVPPVAREVRSIAEDAGGRVWLGTFLAGIVRLPPPDSWGSAAPPEAFGRAEGLPSLKSIKLLSVADEVLAATPEGLYRFDRAAGRFVRDGRLVGEGRDGPLSITRITRDDDGNLWLSLDEPGGGSAGVAWRRPDGSFRLSQRPFRSVETAAPLALLVENDGVVWLGGVRGIARCEPLDEVAAPEPFPVLLREAVVEVPAGAVPLPGRVPFGRNTYRFRFAAPRFTAPEKTRYSALLDGFDRRWSPWGVADLKEYTNLPEGRYVFRVRARDVFGDTSDAAVVRFRVLAPWYRTWWAYGLYALAAVVAVAGAVRIRARQLERERERLEGVVRHRTAELAGAVRELEATTEELQSFSYSVSHDLHAPLRRIRAFSGMLLDRQADRLDDEGRDYLRRVHENAQHLRTLIEAMLELSRVTRAPLRRRPLDLSAMAETIVDELLREAPGRDVDVRVEPGLAASGDPALVEILLRNLLDNALKFTRDTPGARIVFEGVASRFRPPGAEGAPRFRVRDDGVGFDARYGEQLFAPFRRLHDASAFDGSGIGLATVRRIVRRHGGTIAADGAPGEGAAFTFSLEPDAGARHP